MRDIIAVLLVVIPAYLALNGGAAGDVIAAVAGPAQAALEAMAEAERAFVRAAASDGIVPAFVRFFAEDAIGFDGEAIVAAREGWRRQTPPAASIRMRWEPRLGDIAASGDLGWLTGPVERTGIPGRGDETGHACYFSIWRRQADGAFRVFLDTGVETPSAPPFAEGFTRAAHASRYAGTPAGDAARAALLAADRALVERTRRVPLADAYRPCLTTASRLHRNDELPVAGRDRILERLGGQPALASAESRGGGVSAAGDLGYTYGTYAASAAAAEHGWYVRVWTREGDGTWKLTVDITQPQ